MRLLKLIRRPATALLTLGVLLHLVVADSWAALRVLFYALPLPVLSAGWLLTASLWGLKRRAGRLCVVAAIGCGLWWYSASWCHPETGQSGVTALKVLSWNMAHERLPSGDLQTLVAEFGPDIVGLVEVGSRHGDPSALLSSLPPGYASQKLDHGMAVLVRGSVRVVHQTLLPSNSKFAALEAVVDGATWRVFIVDGASRPTTSREDVMKRVLAEARGNPRTVVMGDFNTPLESALFTPWRVGLRHAFNEAGSGFRETWPRPVPVLTIDHVWSSADSPPLHAEKRWLRSSDHAALLVRLGRR